MTERWATFDCYGTLIDWEGGIARTLRALWPDAAPDRLLAHYHEIEPQVQLGSDVPYKVVLRKVLARVASAEGLQLLDHEADALARSLPGWPPFQEVPDALRAIRGAGWHTAILSNTDPDLLDASVAGIGVGFDTRITAAEAGGYKPARGHWDRFFEQTMADRSLHVHVGASIFHDIEPACALGLRAVWVNRTGETSDVPCAAELTDLGALPEALETLVPAKSNGGRRG